jgi:BolA family transcriptional regulator, general stress-responsive regulator
MSRLQRINDAMIHDLKPDTLTIENESSNHHVPLGSETHFKIIAVSHAFTGLPRIHRHRRVNTLLAQEFKMGLHALSLHLYAPDEWLKKTNPVIKSPACLDGYKHKDIPV